MTPRRLVVGEDDALLREGIASLLTAAGHDVVAQAGDAPSLRDAVRATVPDIMISDIRMPPTQTWEGLDVAREIRAELPQIGILLLSAHTEVDTAIDLLQSGDGIGYLLKSRVSKAGDLLDAVDRVADGESVIDPGLIREMLGARRPSDPLGELTPREREVLALMAEGRSNRGIAQALWVTEGAVEKHVRHILAKLDLPSQSEDHRRVLAVLAFLESR
jgi:DNA-binding NarL/FixJ family response regulator